MQVDKLVLSGVVLERIQLVLPDSLGKPRKTDLRSSQERLQRKNAIINGNMGYQFSQASIARSRVALRRIIQSNFFRYTDGEGRVIPVRFLTNTFHGDFTDLAVANRVWSRFIMAMNYEFSSDIKGDLQYVCVPEFQKNTDFLGRAKPKGGNVHFHALLFNLPYVDRVYDRLIALWRGVAGGGGTVRFVTVRSTEDVGRVSSYIAKYVSKQSSDRRFFGHKRFFVSRGVRRPIVSRYSPDNEFISLSSGLSDSKVHISDGGYVGTVRSQVRYLSDSELSLVYGLWPMYDDFSLAGGSPPVDNFIQGSML